MKTTTFGAFVNLVPGRDGLVHISKLGRGKRLSSVEEAIKEGDHAQRAGRGHRPAGQDQPEADRTGVGGARGRRGLLGRRRRDRGGDRGRSDRGGDREQQRRTERPAGKRFRDREGGGDATPSEPTDA